MENFESVWQSVSSDSILGSVKSQSLYNELITTINLEGATAEIGVYKGFTSKLIHLMTPNKTHYCYDTFCGILGADASVDKHVDGDFAYGLDLVKQNINLPNVIYRVGYFPISFDEHNVKFSFVHSDTDTYIGTQNTIKYFLNRMVSGGKILFDDYEWIACPGVKKAISEFIETDTLFHHISKANTMQYLLIKK